jgi:translation initiation factor IF-1
VHESDGGELEGTVVEALPHETYVVELQNGQRVRVHLAGEMRQRAIRVSLGDRVRVALSPFDRSRGRMTRRVH